MKHKKTTAPSSRHPQSRSLQNLHGVNAAAAQMFVASGNGTATAPGAPNHPASASPGSGSGGE